MESPGFLFNQLIHPFFRNHSSYTTTWILYITIITWNQMYMHMKNCLPSSFPTVNANIVTIWLILFI